MAISTYDELKSAITDWMVRSDIAGSAGDFIALAEARLNRKLDAIETDATLAAVAGSNEISLSALSVDEAKGVILTVNDSEIAIQKADPQDIRYTSTAGQPTQWVWDADKIKFDRPSDAAYSVRFRYDQRFALSDAAPTNWLLTYHPDIYLAASIVWGMGYIADDKGFQWKGVLEEGLAEVQRVLAEKKRAPLRIDEGVTSLVGRPAYDWYIR